MVQNLFFPRHTRGPQARGHGGMLDGSQDKRITKPKLEEGKDRKLKRYEKKRSVCGSRKKKTTRGPGASPVFFESWDLSVPLAFTRYFISTIFVENYSGFVTGLQKT